MSREEVRDHSNDHKYFTQVCNVVLDSVSGEAQALYLQMKRLSGDGGDVFAGIDYYRKKTGWGLKKIKIAQKELLDKKLILDRGIQLRQTKGGPQNVHVFEVCDIWEMNIFRYSQRGSQESTPLSKGGLRSKQRGSQEYIKGGLRSNAYKEYPTKIIKKSENFKETDQNAINAKLAEMKKILIEKGAMSEIGITLARDKKRIRAEEQKAKLANPR